MRKARDGYARRRKDEGGIYNAIKAAGYVFAPATGKSHLTPCDRPPFDRATAYTLLEGLADD